MFPFVEHFRWDGGDVGMDVVKKAIKTPDPTSVDSKLVLTIGNKATDDWKN